MAPLVCAIVGQAILELEPELASRRLSLPACLCVRARDVRRKLDGCGDLQS